MKYFTANEIRVAERDAKYVEDVKNLLLQKWLEYDQYHGFTVDLIALFGELSEQDRVAILTHFEIKEKQRGIRNTFGVGDDNTEDLAMKPTRGVKDKFWPVKQL